MDIAKRAGQPCGQILRYAVAHGIIERNPVADVRPSDALRPRGKRHHARVDAIALPGLLFPGERDHERPMSNNTILFALYRMGYRGRMTGHGFRGVASTALHEMGFRHDIIELQLAHQERGDVSAAHNPATYLVPRREMMQAWADHLGHVRKMAVAGDRGRRQ
jgi:hypothetical protein